MRAGADQTFGSTAPANKDLLRLRNTACSIVQSCEQLSETPFQLNFMQIFVLSRSKYHQITFFFEFISFPVAASM